MIVAHGRAGHAMYLDCRSMEIRHVELPADDLAVIVCDSKAAHELTGGEYRERKEQCDQAAKTLGLDSLRDATADQVDQAKEKLGDVPFRRARHVVTEIARVADFAQALDAKDYKSAGKAMYESHASLKDDYEVSTSELDALVEVARGVDGVYGSRMTGAGFGGCTVTLCRPDAVEAVREALQSEMKDKFGIDTLAFATEATAGGAGGGLKPTPMRDNDIHLEIGADGEGGYVPTSPDVPGLVLSTRSIGEAVELAPKVVRDMIEVWRDTGHPLPPALAAPAAANGLRHGRCGPSRHGRPTDGDGPGRARAQHDVRREEEGRRRRDGRGAAAGVPVQRRADRVPDRARGAVRLRHPQQRGIVAAGTRGWLFGRP